MSIDFIDLFYDNNKYWCYCRYFYINQNGYYNPGIDIFNENHDVNGNGQWDRLLLLRISLSILLLTLLMILIMILLRNLLRKLLRKSPRELLRKSLRN